MGMAKTVLITGGAGFIGSHVADELLAAGHHVRALDNLSPQVHGEGAGRPAHLDARVDLRIGDVRDPEAVAAALDGVDAVYHLAAAVGVGQSMYEMAEYTSVNNLGTAVLLEQLVAAHARRPFERLVVASSMSVYGEGRYLGASGAPHDDVERTLSQLKEGQWEPRDASGRALEPVATPEGKAVSLSSIYALSKYDQERMCLIAGRAYRIPTTALRFFNVYGPRQALSNPYTGVLAIFASRLMNGKPPLIFEDGQQRRDFVSVHDVARACRLALDAPRAPGEVLNVGAGRPYTVLQIAAELARVTGRQDIDPEVTGQYRMGDIRHCFADITRTRDVLGYEPRVSLADGLAELAAWLEGETCTDHVDAARDELARRGLTL